MSLARGPLNAWLRLTEKPRLARETDVLALRHGFESRARLFLHAPLSARFREDTLGDLSCLWIDEPRPGPLILYLHGGAFVMGSPRTHRAMMAWLAREAACPVCLPRYRLAPEAAFPAAPQDALSAYRTVAGCPGGVVLGGDSAGGGLALVLLAQILDQGLPKPLGLFAFSPLTDLTFSGGSVARNAHADAMLPASRARETAEIYLQGADPTDPRASPLFADFTGAPPVWLTAGDTEILLDDTRRMADTLRHQGADVTERIAHDLPHVWPMFHNILPEARATLRHLARWIRSLSPPSGDS